VALFRPCHRPTTFAVRQLVKIVEETVALLRDLFKGRGAIPRFRNAPELHANRESFLVLAGRRHAARVLPESKRDRHGIDVDPVPPHRSLSVRIANGAAHVEAINGARQQAPLWDTSSGNAQVLIPIAIFGETKPTMIMLMKANG
jgi:hypothetical protein